MCDAASTVGQEDNLEKFVSSWRFVSSYLGRKDGVFFGEFRMEDWDGSVVILSGSWGGSAFVDGGGELFHQRLHHLRMFILKVIFFCWVACYTYSKK